MKKLISILLLTIITFGATYKTIIIFNYYLNKTEFISKFCKNKQNSECQGKCHLNEIIKEKENDQNSSVPEVSHLKELPIFILNYMILCFKTSLTLIKKYNTLNIYLLFNDYSQKLLKPPTFSYFI